MEAPAGKSRLRSVQGAIPLQASRKHGAVGPRSLGAWQAGGGSVREAGVPGCPEQVGHDASVQLEDGAHAEQVHDLV